MSTTAVETISAASSGNPPRREVTRACVLGFLLLLCAPAARATPTPTSTPTPCPASGTGTLTPTLSAFQITGPSGQSTALQWSANNGAGTFTCTSFSTPPNNQWLSALTSTNIGASGSKTITNLTTTTI